MQALFYLQKRIFCNRARKALHKPVTYLYLALGIFYIGMILFSFGPMLEGMGMASPQGLVAVLTVCLFLFTPSNLISYTKRRGLLYRPSDIHFVFTSPISPKKVLLYAQMKQIIMTGAIGMLFLIGGCFWFHISFLKMFLYFIIAGIVENILEASMVILLYGNESIPEKWRKLFVIAMYVCMAAFVVIGFLVIREQGISPQSVFGYLFMPAIQWIPIIGWNIAVIHLLFLGPTTVNVICSVLYFGSAILLYRMAKQMKCEGEYYEDAMKFADDFEQARAKNKRGEIVGIGKKKKFGKAKITYKGNYAKAIFYRQLLEYKKNRFFIFGLNSVIMAGVGIGIVIVSRFEDITRFAEYIIPGIMAYIAIVFSGYATKWNKELASPYTYLIPDTAFHKLWYATLTEHIRSFFDACLITIPGAIALHLTPLQVILTIGIYIFLQANKLYLTVLVEGILGNLLGEFGKQMMRIVLYMSIIGVSALAAVLGTLLISVEIGFFLLILVMAFMTLGCMFAAAGIFEKMESVN